MTRYSRLSTECLIWYALNRISLQRPQACILSEEIGGLRQKQSGLLQRSIRHAFIDRSDAVGGWSPRTPAQLRVARLLVCQPR